MYEIGPDARQCEKLAEEPGVPFGWLRYPNRIALEPGQDLVPRRFGRCRFGEYARIGRHPKKPQQAGPREPDTDWPAELCIEPFASCSMLRQYRKGSVNQEIGVEQYQRYHSPS